jgi:hypothetical protein
LILGSLKTAEDRLIKRSLIMANDTNFKAGTDASAGASGLRSQTWGGLASFLLAVAFLVAPLIYLVGSLRDAIGRFGYNVADFLYGPVWGASLVILVFVLRERMGEHAPRRMSLALIAAALAAGAMVAVACIRAANRQYHLIHPDLHLESSTAVLIVWTTLVAGVTGAGWHFLGWALLLIGSSGWTSYSLPRLLSLLYVVGGIAAMFVYLLPQSEPSAVLLGVVVSFWQGLLLWKAGREEPPAPGISASWLNQR